MEYKSKFTGEQIDDILGNFISIPSAPSAEWVISTIEYLNTRGRAGICLFPRVGLVNVLVDGANGLIFKFPPERKFKQTEPYDRDYVIFTEILMFVDDNGELHSEQEEVQYDLLNPTYK